MRSAGWRSSVARQAQDRAQELNRHTYTSLPTLTPTVSLGQGGNTLWVTYTISHVIGIHLWMTPSSFHHTQAVGCTACPSACVRMYDFMCVFMFVMCVCVCVCTAFSLQGINDTLKELQKLKDTVEKSECVHAIHTTLS